MLKYWHEIFVKLMCCNLWDVVVEIVLIGCVDVFSCIYDGG